MGNKNREPERDAGLTLVEEAGKEGGWRGALELSQPLWGGAPKLAGTARHPWWVGQLSTGRLRDPGS